MISVTALGILCSVMLAVASKIMAVKMDERISKLREVLPGANCGACGYTGCDGYAEALVNEGALTNVCIPGGDKTSIEISSILGVEAEDVLERVAVVCCRGNREARRRKMEYDGIRSCAAAKQLYGGQIACINGCIGFGDSAAVCPEGAICIDNGLARVDTRKCMGCRLCSLACPNGIILMDYSVVTATVLCKNIEKGAVVRKKCTNGCIGCMKCVKECTSGAITVVDNLARVDQSKCSGCGKCAAVCVTNCVSMTSGLLKVESIGLSS
jgi:Na+-translocating ferredoxin:NAD+ oxidoreductase RNF subunit RnfB